MATSVFISYAANDPDWPEATVRVLAEALKRRGAHVLLDLWHPQTLGRTKLAPDEWRKWMKACVQTADRVICLASPKYLQAVERDIGEVWGYGVAYESLRLIHQLYQNKGHNDGRILMALKDGADPRQCVPDEFQLSCPPFWCPSETKGLIADAIRAAAAQPERPVEVSPAIDPGPPDLTPQETLVVESLGAALHFLHDLLSDVREEGVFTKDRMPQDAVGLVRLLGASVKEVAHDVMLAVRSVLWNYSQASQKLTPEVRQAAVRLYMLCSTRWVQPSAPKCNADSVVKVPDMLLNPIAVLSATLFGGSVYLRSDSSGQALAAHVYPVTASAGEDAGVNLLLAIYGALYPERMGTMDLARKDALTPVDTDRLLADIRVRIRHIRKVEKSSFALVIDAADALEQAPWARDLPLQAFARDKKLAKDLFVIDSDELGAEISHLWRALNESGAAAHSSFNTKTASLEPAMTTPTPSIQVHGVNVSFTTGSNSNATTNVTQIGNSAKLDDLMPLLAELKAEISQLNSPKLRDKLSEQTGEINKAITEKAPDAKDRIIGGLKNIKMLADAADGTDKLIKLVLKIGTVAAPIIGALF